MATQPACAMGAVRVLGTDLVAERLALAVTLGVEPVEGDGAHSAIREMPGGRGPEAVGSDATIELLSHCPSPHTTAASIPQSGGRGSAEQVRAADRFAPLLSIDAVPLDGRAPVHLLPHPLDLADGPVLLS
jgi:threonine dehydrogenase-like Zn-dependent dehydrogenase